jgi:hypothetical protein
VRHLSLFPVPATDIFDSSSEIDQELTKFINEHGRTLDKFQFDEEYPFEI